MEPVLDAALGFEITSASHADPYNNFFPLNFYPTP